MADNEIRGYVMEPYIPEYGFDEFARMKYYNNLQEREAFGVELITFDDFVAENLSWLRKEYECFLSE